jgi:L-amino acid N-acyltransferase YncA
MDIASFESSHWEAAKKIYEEGIATGDATFQQSAPEWELWNQEHLSHSRLVALEKDEVIGWAALTPVSGRCVYAGVAEVSVYVAGRWRGKGIGKKLLAILISVSEENNIWTLQAGIFPENIASLRIHEENGFRVIGKRERIGMLNGRGRDTLFLEKRSQEVGQD